MHHAVRFAASVRCTAQLSLPWVYTGALSPVSTHAYSSTNFVRTRARARTPAPPANMRVHARASTRQHARTQVLLGLVLAKFAIVTNWDQLDQAASHFASALFR